MKKCPENDKILLFHERELSDVEQAEFELHLKTCAECRRELEQMTAEEALLREGIEEAFQKHRVADRIMQQIRHEKMPNTSADRYRSWRYFWLTAFALISIFAVVTLYTKPEQKFHRHDNIVMLQALNDQATLQGEKLADRIFIFDTAKPTRLDGCFLFTVTASQTSVFKMKGQATASVVQGELVFLEANACYELVSGAIITILVNGKPIELSRKTKITAPFNTSDLRPGVVFSPIASAATASASTIIDTNDTIDHNATTTQNIGSSAASISTKINIEVLPASESKLDPTLAPVRNPFADQPLELNGN